MCKVYLTGVTAVHSYTTLDRMRSPLPVWSTSVWTCSSWSQWPDWITVCRLPNVKITFPKIYSMNIKTRNIHYNTVQISPQTGHTTKFRWKGSDSVQFYITTLISDCYLPLKHKVHRLMCNSCKTSSVIRFVAICHKPNGQKKKSWWWI